jgi:hypothetical protein
MYSRDLVSEPRVTMGISVLMKDHTERAVTDKIWTEIDTDIAMGTSEVLASEDDNFVMSDTITNERVKR